jgi:hypothetical protein
VLYGLREMKAFKKVFSDVLLLIAFGTLASSLNEFKNSIIICSALEAQLSRYVY